MAGVGRKVFWCDGSGKKVFWHGGSGKKSVFAPGYAYMGFGDMVFQDI